MERWAHLRCRSRAIQRRKAVKRNLYESGRSWRHLAGTGRATREAWARAVRIGAPRLNRKATGAAARRRMLVVGAALREDTTVEDENRVMFAFVGTLAVVGSAPTLAASSAGYSSDSYSPDK